MKQSNNRFAIAFNYLKSKGLAHTQKDVVNAMKSSDSNISKAMRGDSKVLTNKFITRFIVAYNNIFSYNWLMFGEGEMLVNEHPPIAENDEEQENQAQQNTTTMANQQNNIDMVAFLTKQVEALTKQVDALIEQNTIHTSQISTLLSRISHHTDKMIHSMEERFDKQDATMEARFDKQDEIAKENLQEAIAKCSTIDIDALAEKLWKRS